MNVDVTQANTTSQAFSHHRQVVLLQLWTGTVANGRRGMIGVLGVLKHIKRYLERTSEDGNRTNRRDYDKDLLIAIATTLIIADLGLSHFRHTNIS